MFISPMLLEISPGPFSYSDYIFEPKVPVNIFEIVRSCSVYISHNNDCAPRYPELQLSSILDGKVACADPTMG